ncbi:neuralized-like protein 4 [Ischnura elegans]|uniref:neuralized-like protein 4 n=1 Tax=Ischnura elegans TaxID=197161 RepID=UPI001ED8A708|nr:neuralized-like protein 4 [Ischnura elegans]
MGYFCQRDKAFEKTLCEIVRSFLRSKASGKDRDTLASMNILYIVLSFLLIVAVHAIAEDASDSTCEARASSTQTLNLFINSKKDEAGEWFTTFHASKTDPRMTNIKLNMTQTVYQCSNGQAVHIKGVIRGDTANGTAQSFDRLTFHPKCGINAAISDDGRSVQKIRVDEALNGVLLTHRPLKRNELFEVRLDKKGTKFNYCLGIGVTTYTPESFTIPDHMYNLKSGNWMMYHNHVYTNGAESTKNYGRNFNELKVGDRVGVMVNKLGTLHFYVNGEDQGPAASNLPSTVHGVFELYYNAIKGTIVDPS